jgi:dUTP pyrophosphatase
MESGERLVVTLRRLRHHLDLPIPRYGTVGSSGLDLYAALHDEFVLQPKATIVVPTGIAIELPHDGYEAQVRSRVGLAHVHGIIVLNSPVTVDSDYRGEIKVMLANFGTEPFAIKRGLRLAQLVFAPVIKIGWKVIEERSNVECHHGYPGTFDVETEF